MKKYIIIGVLGAFLSCKDSKSILPNNPKDATIYYWQLANEGMKGDTAKYRLYRQGYLQDSITNKNIFGGLLIYETAKTTHKGTVKEFKNLREKVIKRDSFAQYYEVEETILFTYEDGSIDTVATRLVLENKIWRLKWKKERSLLMKSK
jgi:hypothetical protein